MLENVLEDVEEANEVRGVLVDGLARFVAHQCCLDELLEHELEHTHQVSLLHNQHRYHI